MKHVEIIELKKTILDDNNKDADKLREELKARKTFYLNVMSSPGAGKTSTIIKTIEYLKAKYKIAVMEADIDSDVDAKTILETGIPAIQLHTGGMCHLDADMSRQGLRLLDIDNLDFVILENVGNLVCPAEFDSGACKNVVILSVPEGDDKPLKYPLMFEQCDAVLINKMDAIEAFDFDLEKATEYVRQRNPEAVIFPISAMTGEGIDKWCEWLGTEITKWNS
ncbi:MAG: hydrogenase nickel incorporation protein HypB [Lachnospiraceae bacterium]